MGGESKFQKVLKEIVSLLYWAMLAACTVGPGTVVTCARAGFEQDLKVAWALVFATILAYILQEGSARLTIQSGKSLGECLRIKYRHLPRIYNVSIICWIVSICVFIGNSFFECNCWAGGMSAIYSIPGAENTVAIRVSCCIGFAIVVYGLLYWDKTHHLSVGLGVVLIGMVILFLIVDIKLGIDWKRLGLGLLPSFPPGSSNIILSLVGTTSIGFNLFLGSSMAQDSKEGVGSAQRGIGFAVCGALAISLLIMIVGDGVESIDGEQFEIEKLAELIEETIGVVGLWVFCIGFIAAALSSMLAVPLGAAVTAESMFSFEHDPHHDKKHIEKNKEKHEQKLKRQSERDLEQLDAQLQEQEQQQQRESHESSQEHQHHHYLEDTLSIFSAMDVDIFKSGQYLPKWMYHGIMLSMIIASTAVIAAGANNEDIIQVAQVFNGCLLPFFSLCLLLCINDEQFMGNHRQKWWANILLVFAVTMTFFLAFNVVLDNIFAFALKEKETIKFAIAGSLAFLTMAITIFATSLKKDLLRSFKCSKSSYNMNSPIEVIE